VVAAGHVSELFGDEGVVRLRGDLPPLSLSAPGPASIDVLVPSSDRARIAWAIGADLFHASVDGGAVSGPTTLPAPVRAIAYAKGQLAVVAGGALLLTDEAGGTPVTIAADGAADPVWSPDGATLVFSRRATADAPYALYRRAADGNVQLLHAPATGSARQASFAPDGERLAYTLVLGPRAGEVHVLESDGTSRRLVEPALVDERPRFTPDGAAILFWRIEEFMPNGEPGNFDLWRAPADGPAVASEVTRTQEAGPSFDLAPDGSFLVYGLAFDIRAATLDGTDTHQISSQDEVWREQPIALGRCD
jgi:dipeptidyl aminopeptidase/acylaminoacyl peptidase